MDCSPWGWDKLVRARRMPLQAAGAVASFLKDEVVVLMLYEQIIAHDLFHWISVTNWPSFWDGVVALVMLAR